MMYAVLPRIGKYVMSLCHIWFGVERSNRRGGTFGFVRCFGRSLVSPVACRCCRTVSGLAFKQNQRRRICEIRLAPCCGSACFSSVIFAWIATGSFLPCRQVPGFFSPSSPRSR